MKKVNTKNKSSARKKLIPAAGSLLVSAAMLGTSTYAWFTMSREVEVKNIQMTATTPEDIQLSLGLIGTAPKTPETNGNGKSLTNGNGILISKSNNTAHNGTVSAPEHAWDWSNTADISNYYAIGKLIPASSVNGTNIFFTPDADGVGKTIKKGAEFKQADNGVNGTGVADEGSGTYYKATLHAFTEEHGAENWQSGTSADKYKVSTDYNKTNDDGYYVDIPAWLRTSSTEGVELGVKAYVIPKDSTQKNNTAGEALYRAVRVAILNGTTNQANGGSGANASGTTGLLPVVDGWNIASGTTNGSLRENPFSGTSILNWYGQVQTASGSTAKMYAAEKSGTAQSRFDTNNVYGESSVYNGNTFVKLTEGTGREYGPATQVIIRVWLEGEDPDCWNETAGQDWSINLKFFKIDAGSDDKDIETAPLNP